MRLKMLGNGLVKHARSWCLVPAKGHMLTMFLENFHWKSMVSGVIWPYIIRDDAENADLEWFWGTDNADLEWF